MANLSVTGLSAMPAVAGSTLIAMRRAGQTIDEKATAAQLLDYVESDIGTAKFRELLAATDKAALRAVLGINMISIKDFNAAGDGITDDTAAFQSALDAGGQIYVPPGTYIVTACTATANGELIGSGKDTTIIKRKGSSATGTMLSVSAAKFSLTNIGFDGNKANNSNAGHNIVLTNTCLESRINGVLSKNAKANAGYGCGLYIDSNPSTSVTHTIKDSIFTTNDADGATIVDGKNCKIIGNDFTTNGGTGLNINNYDLTLAQKIYTSIISLNLFAANSLHGIVIGNFIADNNFSAPVYNQTNPEAAYFTVSDNIAVDNSGYGFSISGQGIDVTDNVMRNNSISNADYAGALFNAYRSNFIGNTVAENLGFGIDAGGCQQCIIQGNNITSNGTTTSPSRPGLNLEASINVLVKGNNFVGNGNASGGANIYLDSIGAATATRAFAFLTSGISIRNNYFFLDGTRFGVFAPNNPQRVSICDNDFACSTGAADVLNAVILIASEGLVSGNKILNSNLDELTPTGGGKLVVPDVMEYCYTNSTTTIGNLTTKSIDLVADGVAYVSMTNKGTGYTSAPTVSFTGGGGSGAAGYAVISAAGLVEGVRMTAYGSGYTSAPTVGFSGGGGSSAAATAQWKLPLRDKCKLSIQFNQAETVTRAGTIVVESPSAADQVMAANGFLHLLSQFGRWQVTGKL